MSRIAFYGLCFTFLFMSLGIAKNGNAQELDIDDVFLSVNWNQMRLTAVFLDIEEKTDFYFTYDETLVKQQKSIWITAEKQSLAHVLKQISHQTNLKFTQVNRYISVSKKQQSRPEVLKKINQTQSFNLVLNDISDKNVANYPKVFIEPEQVISGVISNENGEPLVGATVRAKEANQGALTNEQGRFSFTVADEVTTLIVSYIGYSTQEVKIEGRSSINITMFASNSTLDEVIVVGYGVQKKSDITGAVGVVSGDDLLKAPVNNALQGLRGKVAGVNVFLNSGSPTSSPRVVIRGVGTINSSSNPLYVVDGVVMENIQFINPNDIERIEVLKDASSAAIYGARGANGVILVTTKRGSKGGGITVGYDGFLSMGKIRKKMDLLNAEEWLEVVKTGMENTPKYRPGNPAPVFTTDDPNLFDASGKPLYDTDWQDEATRTAISTNHQLSIQQSTENSSFGTFFNYSHMEGIMLNNYMDRVSGKIAYDVTPKKWLKLGMNLFVNHVKDTEFEEGGGHQMPRRTMIEMPPIFPVQFPDGTYSNSHMIEDAYNLEAMANPVHVLETQERFWERNQTFGNVYAQFFILPGLDFRTQFGFDRHNREKKEYSPRDLINISAPNGYARIFNEESSYWQQENYLSYNNEVGVHRINAILGMSWQERTYENSNIFARGFSDDFFRYNNIGAASEPNSPSSDYDKWSMNSYFIRGGYTFNDKYMVTLTGRVDGTSRVGANNKFGFFPSAGLGWMISNESFLADNKDLNELKLRASYGITGNTEIPSYSSLATVSSGIVLLNGTRASSSSVNRLANPDLEWEKTSQFDIGLNAAAFNYRVRLELDFYYKLTTDLLLDRPVPQSSGFTGVRDNIGSVSNRGIEAMIGLEPVRNSKFRWETNFNINVNKNRIESLGENDEDILPGPNWVSGSQTILRVGESLSSFWGYERIGIWGSDEADAAALVGAVPGEAKRSEEKTILGKGLPDFTGSFINTFNYGNFDLTVDIQFVGGVDIMQQYYHSTEDRSGIANGLATILNEGWTEANQNTMVQEIRNQSYAGQNSHVDSRWIANGSYLRGNLFALGYSLSNKALQKTNLQGLRIYASLENAFVIHSDEFQGYDPEASSWEGNQWGQNIFFFQYPKPTTLTLGCSLKF